MHSGIMICYVEWDKPFLQALMMAPVTVWRTYTIWAHMCSPSLGCPHVCYVLWYKPEACHAQLTFF